MNTLSIIKKPVCKFSCLDVHLLEIVFYTFKLNFCFLQHNLTSHLNCPPHLFVGSSFCSLKNRFFFSPLMYLWSFFSTLVVLGSRSEKKKNAPSFLIRIPRNKKENTASFLNLSIFHWKPTI